jgi:hypothetical protein
VRKDWSGISLFNPFTAMLAICLLVAAVSYEAGGLHAVETYMSWAWGSYEEEPHRGCRKVHVSGMPGLLAR